MPKETSPDMVKVLALLPEGIHVRRFGSREEWLAERAKHIGASEVAAVFNASPYDSAYSLYMQKRGELSAEREVPEDGLWMEPAIAARYAAVTGRPVYDPGGLLLVWNERYPWLAATVDRFTEIGGQLAVLELKLPNRFKVKDWDEDSPIEFDYQTQAQLICTGLDVASTAALFVDDRYRFRWKDSVRHGRFQQMLIEGTRRFWEDVAAGRCPDPDSSPRTTEAIKRRHPKDTGERVPLPADAAQWCRRRRDLKAIIASAERELEGVENLIRHGMGDATVGYFPGGEFSWRHEGGNPKGTVEIPVEYTGQLEAWGVPFTRGNTPEKRVLRMKEFTS